MRLRLAMSPWWVQGVVSGVLFGVAMTGFSRYQTGSWLVAALVGLVSGTFFGVLMGIFTSRLSRRMLVGLEESRPSTVERCCALPADLCRATSGNGKQQQPSCKGVETRR